MPITRKQFEMGIDLKTEEWMKKIHSYLTENKDKAFNKEELRQHFSGALVEFLPEQYKKLLEPSTGRVALDFLQDESSAFKVALEKLVENEDVEERRIRDKYYYSASEALEI